MLVEMVAAAGPAGPAPQAQPRARGSPRRKTIACLHGCRCLSGGMW
jgi:hypothetical protein